MSSGVYYSHCKISWLEQTLLNMVDLTQQWSLYISLYISVQLLYLSLIVKSVWVMYCRYCVYDYHSFITFTDGTQIFKKFIFKEGTQQTYTRSFKVLEEQLLQWDCIVFSLVHVRPKLNWYLQYNSSTWSW